jgi:hypothetical protein
MRARLMRALTILLALSTALAALAASVASPPAGAEPAASRVVDRTLLCATRQNGGVHEIEAESFSGVRRGSTAWHRLPFAAITTGEVTSQANSMQNSLAWITSGHPDTQTQLGEFFYPVRATVFGTLAVNRRLCRAAKRIPLSSKGLRGGVAGQIGDSFDCGTGRRVLVRVRAVLESEAALRPHDAFLFTTVTVKEARIVVRTQKGKALALVSTAESGRSRILTGKGCLPE